jgi:hypothetical protein
MIKTHLNVEALPYFAADATCVAIATPIQGMKCQIIACLSLSYTPQNLPSPPLSHQYTNLEANQIGA